MNAVKKIIKNNLSVIDKFVFLFVYPAGWFFKFLRTVGIDKVPLCKKALFQVGVFPIRDHYYEPLFNDIYIKGSLSDNRELPGIDWNVEYQLEILNKFSFNEELKDVPRDKTNELVFYMDNNAFGSGDAEYWYNIIRLKKPKTIIEVGSGFSTLMATKAIKKNSEEIVKYKCNHICIEPYEQPWLESLGVKVIRQKVENVDKQIFSKLGENDILFIDSSHIIRPQGDVLFEYLELIPSLNRGVIVHVHDIFSPKDYLDEWIRKEVKFWNEQYLLEAFLTSNNKWRIIGALNYLHHNHYEKLKEKCPFLKQDREPGSFYMQKIA